MHFLDLLEKSLVYNLLTRQLNRHTRQKNFTKKLEFKKNQITFNSELLSVSKSKVVSNI